MPLVDPRPARRRHGVRRRRRLVVAAFACLLVAAAAAAAVIASRPDAQTAAVAGIACADSATAKPNLSIIAADGRPPLEVCAQLWRSGAVKAGSSGEVPALTPCLAESGAIFVYPGGAGVCEDLGLDPELPAGYADAGRQINAFRRALSARLEPTAASCPSVTEAELIAEDQITGSDLTGWTVEVQTGGAGECASFGLDGGRRVVTVSPLPR